jgi:hypothetical protein
MNFLGEVLRTLGQSHSPGARSSVHGSLPPLASPALVGRVAGLGVQCPMSISEPGEESGSRGSSPVAAILSESRSRLASVGIKERMRPTSFSLAARIPRQLSVHLLFTPTRMRLSSMSVRENPTDPPRVFPVHSGAPSAYGSLPSRERGAERRMEVASAHCM